jgi:SSS family solute:Na+ symporter
MVCFALARSGKIPELAGMIGPDGHAIPSVAQGSFPMLVQYLLPPGLRGIVVAGLLSALMGSLAGVFNACSTLFTVDLYGKWKPGATQHELVRMGRIATTVMVFIAFAWIPVIKNAQGLYGYLQAVQGYLAPPIFVVFFLGVFFKRMNAQGALWSMLVGFALGIFRMIVDTPVTLGLRGFQNGYPHGSFLWIVNNIYFQYFSVLITLVSAIVMVAVSYATSQPDYAAIKNLTFATTTREDKANTRSPCAASLDASLLALPIPRTPSCSSSARFLPSPWHAAFPSVTTNSACKTSRPSAGSSQMSRAIAPDPASSFAAIFPTYLYGAPLRPRPVSAPRHACN